MTLHLFLAVRQNNTLPFLLGRLDFFLREFCRFGLDTRGVDFGMLPVKASE